MPLLIVSLITDIPELVGEFVRMFFVGCSLISGTRKKPVSSGLLSSGEIRRKLKGNSVIV